MKYRIWLVNFGWYSQHEFATEAEALEYAKGTSFECRIDLGDKPVGFYSYFGGYRRYQEENA